MGIERDGQLQGLILIQTGQVFCRIPTQIGKGLVYILFLETAPWNLPVVVTNPRYGQIGTVLIAEAISISLDLGFSGRIGLHSLSQTEEWYAKYCGMTDLGHDPDPKHQNLRYFEMTPVQAANFLSN